LIDFAPVMRGLDALANVICVTLPDIAMRIKERIEMSFGTGIPRAISGVFRLSNAAGPMLGAVGVDPHDVRREVRRFWRMVREKVRGRTLPGRSFWR
jgi:urease accessory protein